MNFQQLRSIRETARRGYNLTEVANALSTRASGRSNPDDVTLVALHRLPVPAH